MKKCDKCEAENRSRAKHCARCGSDLPKDDTGDWGWAGVLIFFVCAGLSLAVCSGLCGLMSGW
jgi:uncharacterized protein (DUF983 family)